MITYNNIPVKVNCDTRRLSSEFNISNFWGVSNSTFHKCNDYALYTKNINITRYIESCTKDIDCSKSSYKLYFTPSSEFPRFKLSDTKFSRCLSPDKADYIVISNKWKDASLNNRCILYRGKECYYLLTESNIYISPWSKTKEEELFLKDQKSYIDNIKSRIFPEDVVFVRYCTNDSILCGFGKAVDMVLSNKTTCIITDKMLDKIINNNFEALTPDTYKSICDMLDSSDETTRGLGLKMLTGFNISKTPNAVRFMLGIRENKVRYLNEWNSVGIEQVKNTIGWRGFGSFPLRMYNIVPRDNDPITDEDKLLIKDTYKNACEFYLNNAIDELRNSGFVDKFGFSISYEIKW